MIGIGFNTPIKAFVMVENSENSIWAIVFVLELSSS
jgi:hypothetical protein